MRECCLQAVRALPGLTVLYLSGLPQGSQPLPMTQDPMPAPRGQPALPWQHRSRAGLRLRSVGPTHGPTAPGLPHPWGDALCLGLGLPPGLPCSWQWWCAGPWLPGPALLPQEGHGVPAPGSPQPLQLPDTMKLALRIFWTVSAFYFLNVGRQRSPKAIKIAAVIINGKR